MSAQEEALEELRAINSKMDKYLSDAKWQDEKMPELEEKIDNMPSPTRLS